MDKQRPTRKAPRRPPATGTAPALAVLTLLPLLAACGGGAGSGGGSDDARTSVPAALTGVRWGVDSLRAGDAPAEEAPEGAYLQIGADGGAEGNYGCNGFSSTAETSGDSIAFTGTLSTEMLCEKGAMAFEDGMRGALEGGRLEADVGDGTLTLTTGDGTEIRLSEERTALLYGTKWTVDGLVGEGTARSLPRAAEGKAWFTLDRAAGKLTGSLGCNRVTAEATVRNGHVTLGPLATTRRMCSDSLMETERTLQKLLEKKIEYVIDHESITLTSENGQGISATAQK